jgi:hypothetical protein
MEPSTVIVCAQSVRQSRGHARPVGEVAIPRELCGHAGRMNHMKHTVLQGRYGPSAALGRAEKSQSSFRRLPARRGTPPRGSATNITGYHLKAVTSLAPCRRHATTNSRTPADR